MRYRQLLYEIGENGVFGHAYYSHENSKLALVGTLTHIKRLERLDDGGVYVLMEGIGRFYIKNVISEKPYLKARVQIFRDFIKDPDLLSSLEYSILDEVRYSVKIMKLLYPSNNYTLNDLVIKNKPLVKYRDRSVVSGGSGGSSQSSTATATATKTMTSTTTQPSSSLSSSAPVIMNNLSPATATATASADKKDTNTNINAQDTTVYQNIVLDNDDLVISNEEDIDDNNNDDDSDYCRLISLESQRREIRRRSAFSFAVMDMLKTEPITKLIFLQEPVTEKRNARILKVLQDSTAFLEGEVLKRGLVKDNDGLKLLRQAAIDDTNDVTNGLPATGFLPVCDKITGEWLMSPAIME